MIGAVVMVHGDDKGLVLPPRIAKNKVAIVPIIFKDNVAPVTEAIALGKELREFKPIVDTRDGYSAGYKFGQYELEGIPLRIELGPKDLEKDQVVLVRRDTQEKMVVARQDVKKKISELLEQIHGVMFVKATEEMQSLIIEPKDYSEFQKNIKEKKCNLALHCGDEACEGMIKEETAATTRVIKDENVTGNCIKCGKKAKYSVYFSRAY